MTARLSGGEVCEFELHVAGIVAEAAVGFAPQRIRKRGFGGEERVGERVGLTLAWLAAADEPKAFGDQRDDEQPEAREQTAKCGKVAQQPCGYAAFVLHGRDYTPAFTPADPVPLFPPNFSGKWLRLREKISEFPPNRDNDFPPNSAPLRVAPNDRDGPMTVQGVRGNVCALSQTIPAGKHTSDAA